jgi:Flp pilus assembly protein TadB
MTVSDSIQPRIQPDTTEEPAMAKTDVADVRENVRANAATALDTVKAQAAAAGESLASAASSALATADKQTRKTRKQAAKRARELADEAATAARKQAKQSAKKARKRVDKASKKARKKAHKRAQELNVAIQEKAGRKPRRGRKVAVVGGVALAGVVVMKAMRNKQSPPEDPYASPTAGTGSGLPGDPGTAA